MLLKKCFQLKDGQLMKMKKAKQSFLKTEHKKIIYIEREIKIYYISFLIRFFTYLLPQAVFKYFSR